MWVQPKFRQPIFTLKPIRATAYRPYYKKILRRRAVGVFSWSSKGGVLWAFFWSRKICIGNSFICSRNFFQSIFLAIRETKAVICAIQ